MLFPRRINKRHAVLKTYIVHTTYFILVLYLLYLIKFFCNSQSKKVIKIISNYWLKPDLIQCYYYSKSGDKIIFFRSINRKPFLL